MRAPAAGLAGWRLAYVALADPADAKAVYAVLYPDVPTLAEGLHRKPTVRGRRSDRGSDRKRAHRAPAVLQLPVLHTRLAVDAVADQEPAERAISPLAGAPRGGGVGSSHGVVDVRVIAGGAGDDPALVAIERASGDRDGERPVLQPSEHLGLVVPSYLAVVRLRDQRKPPSAHHLRVGDPAQHPRRWRWHAEAHAGHAGRAVDLGETLRSLGSVAGRSAAPASHATRSGLRPARHGDWGQLQGQRLGQGRGSGSGSGSTHFRVGSEWFASG